jgi:hypothetical protein
MNKTLFRSLCAATACAVAMPACADALPDRLKDFQSFSPDERYASVKALAAEMERLDGDGLIFRHERPQPWADTTLRLAEEARSARNWEDYFAALKRLNLTYPNMHAYQLQNDALPQRRRRHLPIEITPRVLGAGTTAFQFIVSKVAPGMSGDIRGSEIVSINGIDIADVFRENLVFCKNRLPEQCALGLQDQLERHALFPLKDTLRVEVRDTAGRQRALDLALLDAPQSFAQERLRGCTDDAAAYGDFRLAWEGQNLCVFSSSQHAGTLIFRINSFQYGQNSDFHGPRGETATFFRNWWKAHSATTRRVIVDVTGNTGGDISYPFSKLFIDHPFQTMYASYRRIPELSRPDILKAVIWGQKPLERWFAQTLAAPSSGPFTPPVPQFCAESDQLCGEGRFTPLPHQFTGNIVLFTDLDCMSSCSHFMWTLRKNLPDRVRVAGMADSADTGYSRLSILLYRDAAGIHTLVQPPDQDAPQNVQMLAEQTVVVTRSVDADGRVVSGHPLAVDLPVPWHWDESPMQWKRKAITTVLNNPHL